MATPTPTHALRSPPWTSQNPGGLNALLAGSQGQQPPEGIAGLLANPQAAAQFASAPPQFAPSGNALIDAPLPGMLSQSAPPQAAPLQQQAPQGMQMTSAIAQHLQTIPPDKLAQEEQRSEYMVHMWGTLARKPNLTLKEAISSAGQAVADGNATPEEASSVVSGLPKDPAQLKALVQQRFKASIIFASLLQGATAAASSGQR